MKFAYVFGLSAIATLGVLTACGEIDNAPSKSIDELSTIVQMDSVETSDDLRNCTEKRQESVAFIEDDSSIRICLNEKWETVESVSATKEDLSNCSENREGSTVYIIDEHDYYTCIDGRWKHSSTEANSSSSSKKKDDSSNSDENDKSSSSNEEITSSESEEPTSEEESSSSNKNGESSSSSKTVKPAKASLTTTIYDTDAKLHPAFSCYSQGGEGCQFGTEDVDRQTVQDAINTCIGVIPGIVEKDLGEDKKPVLAEDGKKCFIDEKYFNQLFNYTKDVNEVVAWEMPYVQNEDGLWGYNSDTVQYGDIVGGFFPIDATTDDDILTVDGKKLGPTENVRTRRTCDGPFAVSDTIDFYHYCNTYGWTDGKNCADLFTTGAEPDIWAWVGYTRWASLSRNHHFCMEIHGTFTYSDSLEAAFSANGDQWVFIGNKLAVDNGGTHLNAPGFVQLKQLNMTYDSFMKEGKEYPIDIFYCARRTTMSDISIRTNFAIMQN